MNRKDCDPILAEGVSLKDTHFGKTFIFDHGDAELLIVCTNDGTGWRPVACLLPHQLYEEKCRGYFDQGAEFVVVFPVKAKSFVPVAYRNEYSRRRWEKKSVKGGRREQ